MEHPRFVAALALGTLVLIAIAAPVSAGEPELITRHQSIARSLADNAFGMPIHVQSSDRGNAHEGEVIGVLDAPYEVVRAMALSSAGWCAVATLHPNVKACVEVATDLGCELEMYVGRRVYQTPEQAHRTRFVYRTSENTAPALDVRLEAAAGPYGTRDYRLALEAAPLDARRTVVRLRYGYVAGFEARLASGLYFATAGRNKVGFTVVDTASGPAPVKGVRGAVERNAVRYFLALRAYLESGASLDGRLERWVSLRDRFPHQLESLDAPDYFDAKHREHADERSLRASAGPGCEARARQASRSSSRPLG